MLGFCPEFGLDAIEREGGRASRSGSAVVVANLDAATTTDMHGRRRCAGVGPDTVRAGLDLSVIDEVFFRRSTEIRLVSARVVGLKQGTVPCSGIVPHDQEVGVVISGAGEHVRCSTRSRLTLAARATGCALDGAGRGRGMANVVGPADTAGTWRGAGAAGLTDGSAGGAAIGVRRHGADLVGAGEAGRTLADTSAVAGAAGLSALDAHGRAGLCVAGEGVPLAGVVTHSADRLADQGIHITEGVGVAGVGSDTGVLIRRTPSLRLRAIDFGGHNGHIDAATASHSEQRDEGRTTGKNVQPLSHVHVFSPLRLLRYWLSASRIPGDTS